MKQAGSGHWEFALANGKPLAVSAQLFEDWLLLDAPITGRSARAGWWELLRLNAALQGLSKFVVTPGARSPFGRPTDFSLCPTNFSVSMTTDCGGSRQTEVCRTAQGVHLRADIPLTEDESETDSIDGLLTTRLIETCADLKAAFRSLREEKTTGQPAPLQPGSAGRNDGRIEELRLLCGDTGWPFVERSAGKLMIDLDVRRGFYQAAVESSGEGIEVAVEIVRSGDLRETSRQALSLLMLETGSLVKMARPSVEEVENQSAARFEVRFTTLPSAVELAHAFSALSVACATSGAEARVLQDEAIAANYLAMQGAIHLGAQASLPAQG